VSVIISTRWYVTALSVGQNFVRLIGDAAVTTAAGMRVNYDGSSGAGKVIQFVSGDSNSVPQNVSFTGGVTATEAFSFDGQTAPGAVQFLTCFDGAYRFAPFPSNVNVTSPASCPVAPQYAGCSSNPCQVLPSALGSALCWF
jgi:hypothetical protein